MLAHRINDRQISVGLGGASELLKGALGSLGGGFEEMLKSKWTAIDY